MPKFHNPCAKKGKVINPYANRAQCNPTVMTGRPRATQPQTPRPQPNYSLMNKENLATAKRNSVRPNGLSKRVPKKVAFQTGGVDWNQSTPAAKKQEESWRVAPMEEGLEEFEIDESFWEDEACWNPSKKLYQSQESGSSIDLTESDGESEGPVAKTLLEGSSELIGRLPSNKKDAKARAGFDYDIKTKQLSLCVHIPRGTVIQMAYSIGMRFKK